MKILGLQNWASHDPAAAIVSDDGDRPELTFAMATEERLLRCKNSYQFPMHALIECMDQLGIESLRDIDYLATDYSKIPRWINSGPAYRKLVHDYIKLKLDFPLERILIFRHHDAHAASAFYPSGYQEAAILIVDGVGSDNETISLYHGSGTRITFLERSAYYGPGALYDVVTSMLGFIGNNRVPQPGKTMGLAPYGANAPGPVLHVPARYDGLHIDYSRVMSRLPYHRLKRPFVPCPSKTEVTNEYYSRIAYDVQAEFERAYLHLARYALERTGSKNLVISGGTGLNCVANGILTDEVAPEGFYVYPGCSDESIAIGGALYAYYNLLPVSRPKTFVMPDAYTGRVFGPRRARQVLERMAVPFEECPPAGVAERLANGKIVGWFTGGSETGPRALGHRSILADPRDPGMKHLINSRVKHREWFRPFAPSVLEERASEFFHLDRPSPYMLLARPVREERKAEIPSVVHVDGTSRIQTVSRDRGGKYYEVIEAFGQLTGIPMVLNTSFNDNNEPIVETPEDALMTFLSTEMDFLWLDGLLVDKTRIAAADAANVVSTLRAERQARQRERFDAFVRRCCRGWSSAEVSQYQTGEMVRALWHRRYEAFDLLEQAVGAARAAGRRVAIVGTRDHTQLIADLIPGFRDLNVVRTHYLSRPDWEDVEFDALDDTTSATDRPDVVLITSYEFHEEAARAAAALFRPGVEIVNPYRSWSEDLRFVAARDGVCGTAVAEDPGNRIFFGDLAPLWPADQAN
jgi:carbamoyltransferase